MTFKPNLMFFLASIFGALSVGNVGVSAFTLTPQTSRSTNFNLMMNKDGSLNDESCSRRDMFVKTAKAAMSTGAIASFIRPDVAFAGAAPPTKEELERIKIGHEQIVYLLNNFEKETTVCRENGGECKRDADSVRRYLGLRSTQDPLFQIEKVFAKVKNMDIDPDKIEEFFEATEEWNTAVNMSNSMAFISQFGEYNPGGGKDEVLKYLEESKKQVVLAEKSLSKIMNCLDLS